MQYIIIWISKSGLREVSIPIESESAMAAVIDHAAPSWILGAMRLRREGDRLEWWCDLSGLWRRVVDWRGEPSTSPLDAPVWIPSSRPKRRGGRSASSDRDIKPDNFENPFAVHSRLNAGNPWPLERKRA